MNDIYTPNEEAYELLESRRQDTAVRDRVAEYLGNVLPSDCFKNDKPVALLMRYVPRATEEDRTFTTVAQQDGFDSQWASYMSDQFTTRNPEKVDTVRPPINWSKGQRTRSWIVEAMKRRGGIGELETIYGCSSTEYQNRLREIIFSRDDTLQVKDNTFDVGQWYRLQAIRSGYERGSLARYYYFATMALASTFCVLYEDYDGGPNADSGELAWFNNNVVYPSIKKIELDLELKPIIVRLPFRPGFNETNLSFLTKDEAEQFKMYGSLTPRSDKVRSSNE